MGAATPALTAFEIAVGGRGAALAGCEDIRVHAEAHGTTGLAPFETGLEEDLIKAFFFGLRTHETGARHDHRAHTGRDLAGLRDDGSGAQVFDARVGARADEHALHRRTCNRLAAFEAHIGERAFAGGRLHGVGEIFRTRNIGREGNPLLRAGAPGHGRLDLFALDAEHMVEHRVIIRPQRLPVTLRHLPGAALRRGGAALHIGKRLLVRRDKTRAGAAFDGEIAERHPGFHRQRADGLAAVFDDIAGAAGRAGDRDDMEGKVLRRDALAQAAGHLDGHVQHLPGPERLRGEHMLDLGRADAVRECTEGAVRGRMAVTADDGHARLGAPLLGADDMHDTIVDIAHREVLDAVLGDVARQRLELVARFGILHARKAERLVLGRRVVIGNRKGQLRPAHTAAGNLQAVKRLRGRHLVDEVQVNIEKALAGGGVGMDDMRVPDLVVEGLAGHFGLALARRTIAAALQEGSLSNAKTPLPQGKGALEVGP